MITQNDEKRDHELSNRSDSGDRLPHHSETAPGRYDRRWSSTVWGI